MDNKDSKNFTLEADTKSDASVRKKRPGRGSRKRTTDAFRERVGMKQLADRKREIFKKHGLFDDDANELEQLLTNMSLTVQSYAVPLTISTRGIGFATVTEYNRLITTWSLSAIVEICTIHQYYRVCLHLMYFRIHEVRSAQSETQSYVLKNMLYFTEEMRQLLSSVSQVPVITATVLGAIGKIEGSVTWHSYLPEIESGDATSCALFLNPRNIRAVIDTVNLAATPPQLREAFRRLCPIPGTHWSPEHRILNPDEIWPGNYDADQLRVDISSFVNLLTRVSGRLPRSFIARMPSGGSAAKSGLLSTFPVDMFVESTFATISEARTVTRKRRGPDGKATDFEFDIPAVSQFCSSSICNGTRVVDAWSPEHEISALELTVGAAALVGECHGGDSTARLPINRKKGIHVSPGTVMMMLVDAPRPRP